MMNVSFKLTVVGGMLCVCECVLCEGEISATRRGRLFFTTTQQRVREEANHLLKLFTNHINLFCGEEKSTALYVWGEYTICTHTHTHTHTHRRKERKRAMKSRVCSGTHTHS
jgi:hypothetical protein